MNLLSLITGPCLLALRAACLGGAAWIYRSAFDERSIKKELSGGARPSRNWNRFNFV